jgi:hypothetical protein
MKGETMELDELRWQYVDDSGREMGWFTTADKQALDNRVTDPHTWRELSDDEVDSFRRYLGRLAYEQS